MSRAFLIDASVLIFRAWHSLPPDIADECGRPLNAVYGYARFLCNLLARLKPRHIAVAFDGGLKNSFRRKLFPPYKANRDPAPPELRAQFPLCEILTRGMGIAMAGGGGFEADDYLASMARRCRANGGKNLRFTFVTSDKDIAQLVGARDELWDPCRDRVCDAEQLHRLLGVAPPQVADFLALAGDSADNIPGAAGIGVKTAGLLINRFSSLENIYANIKHIDAMPLRNRRAVVQSLHENRDSVFLYRRLTKLDGAAPLPADFSLARKVDADKLESAIIETGIDEVLAERVRRDAMAGLP